ncbi:hypothetical protein NCS57_00348400 [Fusarium keratoplasticum]|uniref:Uncharacterized protein n=1 Tax=Fusarium keratoplasticum TaxID=1328300 RepID=A0ACC0R5Z7_9HYPO|nr:hypothetical protein NCS57_00348400 [Fusarium keratoplasticum]KAI8674505.1 hypothetical protein NCS57_00348400 [Fusarium keratoplasticum]
MDSSVSCACQQDSNSVALNVQDLVLKLQALATSRRARRNAFPRPRGISCRRHRQKRQPAGHRKPTRYNDKYILKSPSNTNTEPTLPTNKGGDASQPHDDTPRFFDINEILDEVLDGIPSVKVDEIDLTQCEGSEGVEKAVDSAVLVYMTPREMRDE